MRHVPVTVADQSDVGGFRRQVAQDPGIGDFGSFLKAVHPGQEFKLLRFLGRFTCAGCRPPVEICPAGRFSLF